MRRIEEIKAFIDKNNGHITIETTEGMFPYQNRTRYRMEIRENLRIVRSQSDGRLTDSYSDAELVVTDEIGGEVLKIRESVFDTTTDEFLSHINDIPGASAGGFTYHFFKTEKHGEEAYLYVGHINKEQYRMSKKILEKEIEKIL